ncbi:unnamed protein product [Adineta steineri]|uniref:Uncharacterized protein n=1 Tax=Adineta steineri TaxID=433720 RepID=A0A818RY43_9BILA|nr:unnamed protein product [Adineta steineri]CAF3661598.1 unnamed protein product [Adineta steineri]
MSAKQKAIFSCLIVIGGVIPAVQVWARSHYYSRGENCNEMVPMYLLVSGISGLIFLISSLVAVNVITVKNKADKITPEHKIGYVNGQFRVTETKLISRNNTIVVFMGISYITWLVFYIIGIVNVFVPYSKIDYINPTAEYYCDQGGFQAAFGTLIASCLLVIPFPLALLSIWLQLWKSDYSCC